MLKILLPLMLIASGVVSGVYLYQFQVNDTRTTVSTTNASFDTPHANTLIDLFEKPRILPDFNFLDENNNSLTLEDFHGKIILLNIWATWCPPCLEEMPSLDRLQASLGSSDFQVLPLSTDEGGVSQIREFYNELEIKHLDIIYDPTNNISRTLKIAGLPTTFLIDRKGRVLGTRVGFAAWDSEEFIAFIRQLIKTNTS